MDPKISKITKTVLSCLTLGTASGWLLGGSESPRSNKNTNQQNLPTQCAKSFGTSISLNLSQNRQLEIERDPNTIKLLKNLGFNSLEIQKIEKTSNYLDFSQLADCIYNEESHFGKYHPMINKMAIESLKNNFPRIKDKLNTIYTKLLDQSLIIITKEISDYGVLVINDNCHTIDEKEDRIYFINNSLNYLRRFKELFPEEMEFALRFVEENCTNTKTMNIANAELHAYWVDLNNK